MDKDTSPEKPRTNQEAKVKKQKMRARKTTLLHFCIFIFAF